PGPTARSSTKPRLERLLPLRSDARMQKYPKGLTRQSAGRHATTAECGGLEAVPKQSSCFDLLTAWTDHPARHRARNDHQEKCRAIHKARSEEHTSELQS